MLTVSEVASQLKVSNKTVRLWINSGRLAGYKYGKDYRINKQDLEEFIEKSKVHPMNNN